MRNVWQWLISFSLAFAYLPSFVEPACAASNHQIHVNLFGQPCILQGPVDDKVLQAIHSLSPEQLYPVLENPATSANTRKALEKLKALTGTPAGLDRYRDRIAHRLEAQLTLLDAAENYRKDAKVAPLLAAGKKHLSGANQKKFETAVKKAESTRKVATGETFETLFDLYNEGIEADPEEEFHRAIQRLKVQYICSFEESGEGTGDSSDAH
jgi:hypothetical protein